MFGDLEAYIVLIPFVYLFLYLVFYLIMRRHYPVAD